MRCLRRQPLLLSLPLSDENGRPLGLFTLLAGEEPADAARAFALRNNVGPNFRAALLSTLCGDNYGLNCTRSRALAVRIPTSLYLSPSLSLTHTSARQR